MTKRYRIELTETELECLFLVAHEGCERAAAGDIVSMGYGFESNTRAARRALDKLEAQIDARDAADRERELQDAPQFPAAILDGSHDPERADCACDWCEEGRAPAGQLAMRDVSRPGVPMPGGSHDPESAPPPRDWRELRDERERASLGLPTLADTRRMFAALDRARSRER